MRMPPGRSMPSVKASKVGYRELQQVVPAFELAHGSVAAGLGGEKGQVLVKKA